jgi:hypothetical protein
VTHQIDGVFAAVPFVRLWHKANMALALIDVRFWGKADFGRMQPVPMISAYDLNEVFIAIANRR